MPWQKLGTNSDCEDFAIAAVGLYTWLCNPTCNFHTTASRMGKLMAQWISSAYQTAYVVTGYVDPSVARPDIPVETSKLGGHGWCMLERKKNLQSDYDIRYVLVECTAITISYRPIGKYNPEIPVTSKCQELFGGVITLFPPAKEIIKLPTSMSAATLLALDEKGIPFKYKTIATASTAAIERAVCLLGTHNVGVDMSAFMRDKSIVFESVGSASAMSLYNKMFRDFLLRPTPIDITTMKFAREPVRIFSDIKATSAFGTPKYGVVGFTAEDFQVRMGGTMAISPDIQIAMTWKQTMFGDLLFIGYCEIQGLKDESLEKHHAQAVERPENRVNRRLKRIRP